MAAATKPKEQARKLLDQLPDTASWDDVVYEFAVRRSIERGLSDADAGRLTDVQDVRASSAYLNEDTLLGLSTLHPRLRR